MKPPTPKDGIITETDVNNFGISGLLDRGLIPKNFDVTKMLHGPPGQ